MPFNPTLPVNNSNVSSAELRAQFNGLKEHIDELQGILAAHSQRLDELELAMADKVSLTDLETSISTAIATTPNSANSIATVANDISDPPEQVEVMAVRDKLNELIEALHR